MLFNDTTDVHLPEDLNGAPQIKNEEHDWTMVHFFQTTKDDEEDKIPSNHLKMNKIEAREAWRQ